jgi:hypothetical protein
MTMDPTVVHRLKNKLAIILGFCDLLVTEMPDDDKHRPDVLQIQDAARAALLELPPLPAHEFTSTLEKGDAHDK